MTAPSLNIEPLALPAVGSHHDDLWATLCDLGDAHDDGWVLVGGQMVLLHVLQADAAPTRVSEDLDAVVNVRARPPVLHDVLATLASLGFTAAGVSPDEHAHRFERGTVHVDVLAPEGTGRRADLRTLGNATTIETPGGTQALNRAERVPVRHDQRIALVPRPDLLGAIVAKAAAVVADPMPQRHLRDLATLCVLVDDPPAMRSAMTAKDLKRLRAVTALTDLEHEAWQLLDDPELGYTAFRLLIG